jgi:hypothetical protein
MNWLSASADAGRLSARATSALKAMMMVTFPTFWARRENLSEMVKRFVILLVMGMRRVVEVVVEGLVVVDDEV